MQMFSRICVYVFLCVSLLYAGGTVDAHAQQESSLWVFDRYATTFRHPDVHEHFPDVLDAFKNPEVQNVLNSVVINHFVRDPEYIRAFSPDIDESLITLLATDNGFRRLFEDEGFQSVLQNPAEIDELVGLIEAQPLREPGTLTIVSGDFQEGGGQTALRNPLVVLVRDQYGTPLSGVDVTFRVTRGGGRLSRTRVQTNSTGRVQTTLTLGSGGIHQVEASVVGFPSLTQTFTAAAAAVCEVPTPPKPTTLAIVSGNNQSGETGKPLAQPFVVGVLDQEGKPLEGTAVTFALTAGGGRLWASSKQTDLDGRAEVNFTLGVNPGIYQIEARVAATDSLNGTPLTQIFTATAIGVELAEPTRLAKISGDSQIGETGKDLAHPFVVRVKDNANESLPGIGVRFSVVEGGGRLDATAITDERGEATATLTLGALPGENRVKVWIAGSPSPTRYFTATAIARSIAQLPLLYWIESGRLYRFSGSGKENLMPGVNNAVSFTVDEEGGKLYWSTKTDTSEGNIYRANLDGTADEKLFDVDLHKAPLNIAINPSTKDLYWTNESGRILRAIPSTEGEREYGSIKVIYENLVSPGYIALDVSRNKIYWTEINEDMTWNIQAANLPGDGENGNNVPKLFKKDLGPLEGITVVGDKVYWTEEIDRGARKVSCLKVNGSGEIVVKILESIPLGLAFNGSSLYWTTPHGGIQRVDLIALGNVPAAPSRPAAPSLSSGGAVETVLLANYPNPSNPETWIPYQLSESSDVSVSIYSVNGHLVRRLDLGHQVAGVYQSRSRAAYWDGRNAFGEPVASGLYFYTFTAADFTATRKMLIRK